MSEVGSAPVLMCNGLANKSNFVVAAVYKWKRVVMVQSHLMATVEYCEVLE